MGRSNLGIFHTVIGIVTLAGAVVSFINFGRINLAKRSGKFYFYGTFITSLTALGLSKHGGFNPGHVFSLFIIIMIAIAYYLHSTRVGNNRARFIENFLLSFSVLLSLVPTVNETLTRVPVGKPLAHDITDPVIGRTLLVLLIFFVIGSVVQFKQQRKHNRLAAVGVNRCETGTQTSNSERLKT